MAGELITDEHIRTQDGLAIALERSVRQLYTYFQRGMPGKKNGIYDVAACKKWMADNLGDGEFGGDSLEDLRRRRLLAECDKLEQEARAKKLKNDRDAGDLLDVYEVEQYLCQYAARVKSRLEQFPTEAVVSVPGDQRNTVRAALESAVRELLTELSGMSFDIATEDGDE